MKKIYFAAMATLVSALVWAQQGSGTDVKVDIDKGGTSATGGIPWMWIIGAIVLILVILALSGGSRRRRVTTVDDGDVTVTKTTTVRRETDVDPDAI